MKINITGKSFKTYERLNNTIEKKFDRLGKFFADDIVVNFDDNGGGAIVNSSRGIMFAYEKEGVNVDKWQEESRKAAIRARKELCGAVNSYLKNKLL